MAAMGSNAAAVAAAGAQAAAAAAVEAAPPVTGSEAFLVRAMWLAGFWLNPGPSSLKPGKTYSSPRQCVYLLGAACDNSSGCDCRSAGCLMPHSYRTHYSHRSCFLCPGCSCALLLSTTNPPQRQLERGVQWPTQGTKFWEQPPRGAPMPVDVGAGKTGSLVQPRDSRSLDIVHFTAELAPIAKVSHLGLPAFFP